MRQTLALAFAAVIAAPSALAAVTSASPTSFVVRHVVEVRASARAAYDAIGDPGRWWSDGHTYSGQAANMRMELAAGGCFCERWGESSVEHARVILALPGKAVRLDGALGPLQDMAVSAILHFAIAGQDGRTTITATYRVRGAPEAALDKVAPAVDKVIGEQVQRLGAYLER
jgi:hypothetical protein